MGGVDANLLERLAKIMSYMRPSAGGKRLKRKEKLQMLGQGATVPLPGIQSLKAPHTNGSVRLLPSCLHFSCAIFALVRQNLSLFYGSYPAICHCQSSDCQLLKAAKPRTRAVCHAKFLWKTCRDIDSVHGMQAAAEPAMVKPADADEDIFGNAGKDYEAELPKKRASAAPAAPRAPYFDHKDDMADLPALPKAGLTQHPHPPLAFGLRKAGLAFDIIPLLAPCRLLKGLFAAVCYSVRL